MNQTLQCNARMLTLLVVAIALGALLQNGCGKASSLFYKNENTQAIQRDTVNANGTVSTTIQNPQDAANGTIKLPAVESLGLQSVEVQVPAGIVSSPFDRPRKLNVPTGFAVSVHATELGRPRDLALREDGTLFFSDQDGRIMAIGPDGTRTVIASDLRSPHGIELYKGNLYYTDETRLFRFDFSSPTSVTGTSTMLTDLLPVGGFYYTRTIRWSATEDRIYISVGGVSNDDQDDRLHATILRLAEGEKKPTIYTRGGLQNTVGMDFHPETGELWGVDFGERDLSQELAPEEINILRNGKNYGWPFYYSKNFTNPKYKDVNTVLLPKNPEESLIDLQGYSEPLDLQFYTGNTLGGDWKNSMLITYHGYINRYPLTGFKVVRLRCNQDGTNARVADFVTGFLDETESVWGAPVGIAIAKDGKTFYISDDKYGVIYKVWKK